MVRPVQPAKSLSKPVIVSGLRTPFGRMQASFKHLSALDLAVMVVRELLERVEIDVSEIDAVVFGQVVPSVSAPNIARELVLAAELPTKTDAYTVSRACATSTQAVAEAAMLIQTGQAKVVLAGGADSASDVPVMVSKPLSTRLIEASLAKTPLDKVRGFFDLSPRDLLPIAPSATERATGLTMGESAEKMARDHHISRVAQDELAHASHTRAAAAWAEGLFEDEVMTARVPPSFDAVRRDDNVREDSNLDGYAKLRPAFDRRYGTITAGNSSPLSDGAAAVLVMRADVSRTLGYKPLGAIRSWAFSASDPHEHLLMGPAYAIPRALDAARLDLADIELVDMHEAFAAQVLCNLEALGSTRFAQEKLGRDEAVGDIDPERFNIHGGSIALGHPFAATGARQLTTVLNALKRREGGLGLVAQCAAGGLGAAMIVEV